MSVSKFLLSSCVVLALVATTIVRAQQPVVDSNVVPTNCGGCCEPACGAPQCCGAPCCPSECCGPDCCDEKYHSECCGEGCPMCNMRCRECCGKVCISTVEEVTEERSCWKIECEEICVPRVVCPWAEGGSGLTMFNFLKKKKRHGGCGDCCDTCCDSCCCSSGCCMKPRCGDVRCVRVLSSEDYECTKCQCKWDIKDGCFRYGPGCCGRSCCDSACCGSAVGCSEGCDCAPVELPPAPAPEVPPAPTSASHSSNGKYRVTIAQAFGIKRISCEEPVAGVPQPIATEANAEQPPTKKSWKLWK